MKIQNRYEYDPNKDLLGRGGFARVYRAHDTLLHRDVALKVFSDTGGHRYSVLDEIRKAIGLEHPNLLRYYDVVLLESENHLGEKEQTQIGVMELANAGDLKQFARSNPGSPVLYKLLKEVLQGLEYLHGKGIIHRDLKAQNILLVKQDGRLTAKISDFGISKDMGSGGQSSSMMVGTVEYMAPEQFSPAKYGIDGKVSSNLDLWSFGIMVHELLTDSTPFGSRDGDTTVEQIMAQILSTELPQDIERLPEPYKSVVRKCLVANAKERIRKASELIGYFEGQGSATTPAQDDVTRTYPKASPAASAPHDNDATKVYPKAGAASSADADATKVYGEKPKAPEAAGSGHSRRKGVLLAAVAGLLLAVGVGGGWYVSQRQESVQVQAKPSVEAKVVADAKALAEAKTPPIAEETAKSLADLGPGKVLKDCADCPEVVVVPAGSFEMGLKGYSLYSNPAHRVSIGRGFGIGKTEVTQRQWQKIMGSNPSRFAGCDECPVERVRWSEVQEYLKKLSQVSGKTYRLPTEAEWEYACQAGRKSTFCGGDKIEDLAWYLVADSTAKPRPVAGKKPNAWGLHDMTGNVEEWVQDCWNENYKEAPTDGSAWAEGDCSRRVFRGGSWTDGSGTIRGGGRWAEGSGYRDGRIGVRVVRTVP